MKTAEADVRQSMAHYTSIIKYIIQLQNGTVHQKVMPDVECFVEDGYNEDKAIKIAIKKKRYILEGMWDDTEEDMETDKDL